MGPVSRGLTPFSTGRQGEGMTTQNDLATALPTTEEANTALWIEVDSDDVPFVVNGLLEHACGLEVSDLFFCAEEQYFGVSGRYVGLWQPLSQLSTEIGKRSIAHIKSMAGMNIAEHRHPLDGRWMFQRSNGETVDLRISTL